MLTWVTASPPATITFYFLTIQAKVEALSLTSAQERAVYDQLIPGIYLRLVANKAATTQERQALRQQAQCLLAPLQDMDSPFFLLDLEQKELITGVATECAQLFQRSSSCTEGRNGQLALRHHSLHRLSHRKLTVLTTVHNYFITRPDGSTAAQRFFNADPRSLSIICWRTSICRADLPRSGHRHHRYHCCFNLVASPLAETMTKAQNAKREQPVDVATRKGHQYLAQQLELPGERPNAQRANR